MQIVTEEQLPTIAVVRLTEDMPKIEFVRKLLSESKKMGLKKVNNSHGSQVWQCRCDAFSGRTWREIPDGSQQTPGIKKDLLEVCSGKRKAISKYGMRSNGRTTFRSWPVIKKRLKEKKGKRRWAYLMYATNVERRYIKRTMKDVPE